jgi:hypothetical protein
VKDRQTEPRAAEVCVGPLDLALAPRYFYLAGTRSGKSPGRRGERRPPSFGGFDRERVLDPAYDEREAVGHLVFMMPERG